MTAVNVDGGLVAGMAAEELAAQFGTPLYVYDLDVVTARVEALRAALPSTFDLAFAVKANPALGVLRHLAGLGLGADVASGGELEAARRAGFPPGATVFTGPGKRDDELAAAVGAGLRAVTVESLGELERLRALAASAGRRIPVLLRASAGAGGGSIIAADDLDKFGMLPADLEQAAAVAASDPHLELLGLHAFHASNVLEARPLINHVRDTVARAAALADGAGVALRLVDVGGGLGIPYADGEAPLNLDALGRGLGELATGWAADPSTAGARFLLEPGRFLVGPAGIYLSRVLDLKATRHGTLAIVDGGVHHLLRPALLGQEQRLRVVTAGAEDRPMQQVSVAGPLCTGLDRFAVNARLPEPAVGDLVAVLDAGAYGFSESMPLFLSHPTPADVAIEAGRARLIRPRIHPADILDRQVLQP